MDGQTNYTYQPGRRSGASAASTTTPDRGVLRRDPRGAPAELAPPVRQRRLDRQERLGRRAPVQGRRAVGPPLLRVGLLGAGSITGSCTTTVCRTRCGSSTPRRFEERRQGARLLPPGLVVDDRLTLNIGGRWDRYVGTLPEQSAPGGNRSSGPRVPETEVHQPEHRACGALGACLRSHRLRPHGLKASYSRYGLQVGIDRVTASTRSPTATRTARGPTPTATAVPASPRSPCRSARVLGRRRHSATPDGINWPVLGRSDRGHRDAAPGRRPLRHDVLLPHQPRSVRPAQPGGADRAPTRRSR